MHRAIAAAFVLLLLAGCGTSRPPPPPPQTVTPPPAPEPEEEPRTTLADLADAARGYTPSLFGSVEKRVPIATTEADGNLVSQWHRIRDWMRAEDARFRACIAAERDCDTYEGQRWRAFVVSAQALPPLGQLHAVNRYFNAWPYLEDSEVYGADDYWATPLEFMRSSGDCEDFAIAKFMALRQLGFPNAALRIVVITDQIRRKIHAVVAVYIDDDVLILDSLSEGIFPEQTYQHYIPHVSVNETTLWEHYGRTVVPVADAAAWLGLPQLACAAPMSALAPAM